MYYYAATEDYHGDESDLTLDNDEIFYRNCDDDYNFDCEEN